MIRVRVPVEFVPETMIGIDDLSDKFADGILADDLSSISVSRYFEAKFEADQGEINDTLLDTLQHAEMLIEMLKSGQSIRI